MIFVLLLTACEQETTTFNQPQYSRDPIAGKTVYLFAVHPLHNPSKLVQSYQPLMEYLNRHIDNVRFEVVASRDYQAYEASYQDRGSAFLLPNPWQTLQAMQSGYRVIAAAGNSADFRGIFIVRKDGNINTPADLKGKTVSYPSPTALAACMMPQYFLYKKGINVLEEIDNQYVGSQESSIMHVFLQQSAAAATWPPPWREFQKEHPDEAAQLKLIWTTEPLINNSVMVRDDVPEDLVDKVKALLIGLYANDEGHQILQGIATDRFYPAGNESYSIVKDFIDKFETEVRPVLQS